MMKRQLSSSISFGIVWQSECVCEWALDCLLRALSYAMERETESPWHRTSSTLASETRPSAEEYGHVTLEGTIEGVDDAGVGEDVFWLLGESLGL